jgi:hypothetical protein
LAQVGNNHRSFDLLNHRNFNDGCFYNPCTGSITHYHHDRTHRKTNRSAGKALLEFAMRDLRNAIYNPSPVVDAATLGWLTQKIESLAKENTQP